MLVLVINAGSSSLKYQVMNMKTREVITKGLCERIGIDGRHTNKTDGNKYVEEVIAPNAEIVGALAFEKCENLRWVDLSNATSISESAFDHCESLAADNIKTPK